LGLGGEMAVEALPDLDLDRAAGALLDDHGAAGKKLAGKAPGNRQKLLAIGVERDEREPERKPSDRVAEHGAGLPAIAHQHAAADEHEKRSSERHIAEGVAVEIGDGAGGVAHEQHGCEGQDKNGNPRRQFFSLSLSRWAPSGPAAPP